VSRAAKRFTGGDRVRVKRRRTFAGKVGTVISADDPFNPLKRERQARVQVRLDNHREATFWFYVSALEAEYTDAVSRIAELDQDRRV